MGQTVTKQRGLIYHQMSYFRRMSTLNMPRYPIVGAERIMAGKGHGSTFAPV